MTYQHEFVIKCCCAAKPWVSEHVRLKKLLRDRTGHVRNQTLNFIAGICWESLGNGLGAGSYGVRRHFPASQLAEIYFCYSSLKSHSIFMKSSAVVSH